MCENPTYFSFLLQDEKEEENHGSETKLVKKFRSRVLGFLKLLQGYVVEPVGPTAASSLLPYLASP